VTEVEEILLFDDLDAGIDDLTAIVLRWGERVEDLVAATRPFDARDHVRITFLSDAPPVEPETFRLTGFYQELGEAPVYVDEILEAPPA
jgi:hypothetical protein